ncbi:MAG: hypothetical protein L7U87_04745 [Chlamydiales bacterium]|nr:hypothetical protein [Chlamydiales bacterium]
MQASLLAKTEVTDRLSTVLGWDVSRNGEATLDGLIDLIEGYVGAYQEHQGLKLEVLQKLNGLLTKYEITPLNDLSEFDPKALEARVNASILEAGETESTAAGSRENTLLNAIYDRITDGRGERNVGVDEIFTAIEFLQAREVDLTASLNKLERETLTALREENQSLKVANEKLAAQLRSLSVSVDQR